MIVCMDFKASGLLFGSCINRFPMDSKQAGQCIPTLETQTRAEQFLRPELSQARLPRSPWLWGVHAADMQVSRRQDSDRCTGEPGG